MRILNTLDYINEKLAIQPMTNGRLKSYVNSFLNPKSLLRTGIISIGRYGYGGERAYIYISKNDIEKYTDIFNFFVKKNDTKLSEGIFIRYNNQMWDENVTYRYVSNMNDNLCVNTFATLELLEDDNQPNPMDFDYFERVTGNFEITNMKTIWRGKTDK